jgi:GNAT superfamily N-acetyltransferase
VTSIGKAAAATVRSARADEAGACRALLPRAFPPFGPAPELLVAAGPDGIAGVLALGWVPRDFPMMLHVLPNYRRAGLGRALVDAAVGLATGETNALRAWHPVDEDGPACAFLQAVGFQVVRRLLPFEIGDLASIGTIDALVDRARRAGRIPGDARLVALAEAPPQEIARLVAPEFAALPRDVVVRIAPGAAAGYDPALSLVLMRGDRVAAVMLCSRDGDLAEVEAAVVEPGLRGGWPFLLMVSLIGHRAYEAGLRAVRFACEEHVLDVLAVARRTRATALPPQVVLRRPLYSAASA